MKTAAEIAREVCLANPALESLMNDGIERSLILAIEADRAQLTAAARELRITLTTAYPGKGWAMPSADVSSVMEAAGTLLDLIAEPQEAE